MTAPAYTQPALMAVASIAHALAHAPIELVAAFAEGAERREG